MKPILDRVIIKQDDKAEATKGGILLPAQAQNEKPRGKVVSVGPSVKDVRQGDYVLFNVNYHQKFADEGQEYVTINEADVLAILSTEDVAQANG